MRKVPPQLQGTRLALTEGTDLWKGKNCATVISGRFCKLWQSMRGLGLKTEQDFPKKTGLTTEIHGFCECRGEESEIIFLMCHRPDWTAGKLPGNRTILGKKLSGIRNGQDLRKLNFAIGIWQFGLTNLGHCSDWSFLNFPAWWSSAKGVHLLLA